MENLQLMNPMTLAKTVVAEKEGGRKDGCGAVESEIDGVKQEVMKMYHPSLL